MSAAPKPRNRDSVFLMALVVQPGRDPTKYRVRNLSREGACVEQPVGLTQGDAIRVTIGALEDVPAEVAWTRAGFAGLRFVTPIETALARKHGIKPARRSGDLQAGWLSDTRRPHQRVWG